MVSLFRQGVEDSKALKLQNVAAILHVESYRLGQASSCKALLAKPNILHASQVPEILKF